MPRSVTLPILLLVAVLAAPSLAAGVHAIAMNRSEVDATPGTRGVYAGSDVGRITRPFQQGRYTAAGAAAQVNSRSAAST